MGRGVTSTHSSMFSLCSFLCILHFWPNNTITIVLHISSRISIFWINVMLYRRTLLFSTVLIFSSVEQHTSTLTSFKVDLMVYRMCVLRWQKQIWKSLCNAKVKPPMSCFCWTEECAVALGEHVTHSSELRVLPCWVVAGPVVCLRISFCVLCAFTSLH